MVGSISLSGIEDETFDEFAAVALEHGMSFKDALHIFIKQVSKTGSIYLDGAIVDEHMKSRSQNAFENRGKTRPASEFIEELTLDIIRHGKGE